MKYPISLIFLSITSLFLIFLLIKAISKYKFCTLCASVALTWISLLILFWLNKFSNPVLVALLIGNSVVGIYYLAEKKISEKFHIFRLPFFLTLLLIGYSLVFKANTKDLFLTLILIASLWIIFGFIYFNRNNPKLKSIIESIINCCKNW